jgi:hypothetical protein
MRAAPPVEVSLASGHGERAVVAFTVMMSAMILTHWLQTETWHESGSAGWLSAAVFGAAVMGAAVGWRTTRPMQGKLRWDGTTWALQATSNGAAESLGAVHIALDFGGWVLLRSACGRWCGLSAGQAGARWHGLQVALRNPLLSAAEQPAP